jgi:hypothetical protein
MHKLVARIRNKPEDDGAHGPGSHRHLTAAAVIVAVIIALVVLHLTGNIGAGSH